MVSRGNAKIRAKFRTNALNPSSNSPFSPLRYPAFRMIWIATLVSNLGALIQNVGAGWMMAELTTSHDMIALVQAATTLPVMLMAIPAGAFADNMERRRVMLASQSFMALVSLGLAFAAWQDLLSPWTLLTFTFLLGIGSALHMPSWQASIRDMVPLQELPTAVTLNSMSFNLMRAIGPAVGGAIVAWSGPPLAFALNAISYTALIWALFMWKAPREEKRLPAERLDNAIAAGLRYVMLSPNLGRVMLRGLAFGGAAVAILALLPVITRDLLKAEAATYGVLLGAFGFGAIFGALFSPWLRRRFHIETIVAGGFVVFAIGGVIVASSSLIGLTLLGLMISGTAWVSVLSLFNVSTQLAAPRWVVGRAISIYQALTFGGMAAGSWVWGAISESYGTSTALYIACATLILGATIGLRWPMPDMSDQDLDPANTFHEPALRLNMKARSGPIMIMIDWDIAPDKTEAFLAEMTRRRHVRLRDGAQQWTLMRDLENPDIWVESYHVPTWIEYLRHHSRATRADIEVHQALLKLHRGPGRPHVHRMIERRSVTDHVEIPILEHMKTP